MKTTFVDLKNPDLYRDGIPHEVFTGLRRDTPIAWNPEDNGRGFWAVTRYEDIVAVSKRPEVFFLGPQARRTSDVRRERGGCRGRGRGQN